MKDYYSSILEKIIASNNNLDDFVIKQIVNVVQNINYIDLTLDIYFNCLRDKTQ